MKKITYTVSVTIIVIMAVIAINPNHCKLPDQVAVDISKEFIRKMKIRHVAEPAVVDYDKNLNKNWLLSVYVWFSPGDKYGKTVVITNNNHTEQEITVSCERDITYFCDTELNRRIFQKYNISSNNRIPRKWPPLLSEKKAQQIATSFASNLGPLKDMEFSKMRLDLNLNGTWVACWKRTLNGYPYEDDLLSIEIMAIDGELYRYEKRFLGKPCPTEVKVSKEDAISQAWKKASSYFSNSKWEKIQNEYEVKSADLKIIQPNAFFGFVMPMWKSKYSRLAWVITLAPKIEPDDKKRLEIGYHDQFIIKIDAADNRFLGGVTGIYR